MDKFFINYYDAIVFGRFNNLRIGYFQAWPDSTDPNYKDFNLALRYAFSNSVNNAFAVFCVQPKSSTSGNYLTNYPFTTSRDNIGYVYGFCIHSGLASLPGKTIQCYALYSTSYERATISVL